MFKVGDCVYIQCGNDIRLGVIQEENTADAQLFFEVRFPGGYICVPTNQCYATPEECAKHFNFTYYNRFMEELNKIKNPEDLVQFLAKRVEEERQESTLVKDIAILGGAKFGYCVKMK